MIKKHFVNINGDFFDSSKPSINSNNRAFLYGDGFFETIRCNGTTPLFFDKHLERISKGFELYQFDTDFRYNKEFFQLQITRTLNKNRFLKAARVRITFFRISDGFYTPNSNNWGFLIDSSVIDNEQFYLNTKGLSVAIYRRMKKHNNVFSPIKNINSTLFVDAALFKNKNNLDDAIILNEQENICECISSNLFIVNGKDISTPSLSTGCVAGIMRNIIIDIAKSNGYNVFVKKEISIIDVENAEEVFITNAIQGIRYISIFGNRRYDRKASKELVYLLNQYAFKGVFL
ncbi:MAG: aminotransferase class IV family protein [Bacteroidales bacterium]|nr:aminotransferase class IV family protein [Bacteroidales bacterium]